MTASVPWVRVEDFNTSKPTLASDRPSRVSRPMLLTSPTRTPAIRTSSPFCSPVASVKIAV